MFTPFEPRAGPIGGAGLACPPLHCNFTKPEISFAMFLFFGVSVARCAPLPNSFSKRTIFGTAKVRKYLQRPIF